MRKIYLLPVILLLLGGCEKKFDVVVDPVVVPKVVGPQQLPFDVKSIVYPKAELPARDSVQLITVRLSNALFAFQAIRLTLTQSGVPQVVAVFDLFDNGSPVNGDAVAGDSIFSGYLKLSIVNPRGSYLLSYQAVDSMGVAYFITQRQFYFLGKNNAPVLVNIFAPDTLTVIDSLAFGMAVKAYDAQGLSDIKTVYFITYKPDGTTTGTEFPLFDDGLYPDEIADDSLFTAGFKVTAANTKGTYRFRFMAKDRSGDSSIVLNHFLTLR